MRNRTAYENAKAILGPKPTLEIAFQIFVDVYLCVDMFYPPGLERLGGFVIGQLSFGDGKLTVADFTRPIVFVYAGVLPVRYLLAMKRLLREIDQERARNAPMR